MNEILKLLESARFATDETIELLPRSEGLLVAIIRNRPDWIRSMGFTLAEAIEAAGRDNVLRAAKLEKWLRLDDATVAKLRA